MNFNPWRSMLSVLWDWGGQPALHDWLRGSKPGDTLVVLCDSPREKGNVQSRVNAVCKRHGLTAEARRTTEGVMVVRL